MKFKVKTLSPTRSLELQPLYAKQSVSIDAGHTAKCFYNLCLEFSDVICIKARAVDEAVHRFLQFRDNTEPKTHTEPQLIILLETTPSRTTIDETHVKKHLEAYLAKEGIFPSGLRDCCSI